MDSQLLEMERSMIAKQMARLGVFHIQEAIISVLEQEVV